MKKKITSLILIFLLIMPFALSLNASAVSDSPADNTASYYLGETFYSFLNPKNETEFLNTRVNLQIDDSVTETTAYPRKITNTDTLVSYMFLIDASTSMPASATKVSDVVSGLLNNEKQTASVSVATMGEKFEVLAENITSKEHVLEAVNKIKYIQEASEICDGILDAVAYLKSKTPQPGELVNIVVITDGDVYMSDTGRSPEAIARVADSTKNTVKDISEIVIHTVCFGEWSNSTYDAVSVGSGIDLTAYSSSAAAESGAKIAGFVDSLSRVDIRCNIKNTSSRFDAELLTTAANSLYSESIELSNIRNMNVEDSYSIPLFDEGGNLIPRNPSGSTSEEEDSTESNTDKATDKATEKTTEQITAKDTVAPLQPSQGDSESEPTEGIALFTFLPIIIIAAVIIVVAALLIFIFVKRSKSKKNKNSIKSGPSIRIQTQVICGVLKQGNTEIMLYDELFIGSGDECDIVFEDNNMPAKCTRVFFKDGIVYIEDLNENSNTYLGGMKIYSPNRLRSGDEISIGNSSFILRF
ncbi:MULTISPECIES: VWA domain-containing protein [unclassified Ruminococcus]|uniref:VWA domain-containing protein n=1 Tax=unclassified Ruminococcus TaxID=2608920 RepID=UPI002109E5AD|nr:MULTISPECIES: VWA domain-containing protein [unclassified Ruminococcus]MCQ4022112.1 VWA domain-containing protein [Ruminococcus sp. zg-924]MCQ4114432.1 VWA domain-containing protein [Ruminococcus sp. zg-921]